MARPARNADANEILSSERMALLFIGVLRSYVNAKKFVVHDFVVMPDHVHLLMTLDGKMSIEKAVQLVKGGFSYRAKRELGYPGEIWQRGFSEVRVDDRAIFLAHREYIYNNPVEAGLVDSPEKFPYCSLYLKKQRLQGLKPEEFSALGGTAKAMP